jgi:aldose 1-epimerase
MLRQRFGLLSDGTAVDRVSLRSAGGVEIDACTYGAIITSIRTPDRRGVLGEIALGHDALAPYEHQTAYLGAVVGRYANRIAYGRFRLDGQLFQLSCNDHPHHLHGGRRGFDRHVWHADSLDIPGAQGVRFSRVSPAEEENYPGTVAVSVDYVLTNDDALQIRYSATTDAPTILNLTQHSYFNLSATANVVDDHVLTIHADRFTPIDRTLIPTGELAPVDNTPFDFRRSRRIGEALEADDVQLQYGNGFDHNWVARGGTGDLALVAEVSHPPSGRRVTVYSTEPGVQFYSGNFLDGTIAGRHGVYHRRAGLCLETQRFPNTPNEPGFGTAVLRPGERYTSTTVFTFRSH